MKCPPYDGLVDRFQDHQPEHQSPPPEFPRGLLMYLSRLTAFLIEIRAVSSVSGRGLLLDSGFPDLVLGLFEIPTDGNARFLEGVAGLLFYG